MAPAHSNSPVGYWGEPNAGALSLKVITDYGRVAAISFVKN